MTFSSQINSINSSDQTNADTNENSNPKNIGGSLESLESISNKISKIAEISKDVHNYYDECIRQDLNDLKAYPILELPEGAIKLDAMENPHSIPAAIMQELAQHLANAAINRYPPSQTRLHHSIFDYLKHSENFENSDKLGMVCGNGSDELITLLTQMVPLQAKILAPMPSFVMYKTNARILEREFIGVDLKTHENHFALNVEAMQAAINEHRPALIYLPYPNNPTGTCFAETDIAEILATIEDLSEKPYNDYQPIIVFDEAYSIFTNGKSYLPKLLNLLQTFNNVAVMRTFSKIGLAGLRLGYAIASTDLAARLNAIRPPYNINILSYETACFLLKNHELFYTQAQDIMNERLSMQVFLSEYPNTEYVGMTEANFLVWRHPRSQMIYEALLAANIYIKNIAKMHPHLENCLRISIGSQQENQILKNILNKIIKNGIKN